MSRRLIALLTDFGTSDIYVGVMKAVILSIVREVEIVDLTHELGAHDVREGAFLLWSAAPYFPADTVFLAVVDPGVGSGRRGLVSAAGPRILVGPDNGLFTPFWIRHPESETYELASPEYCLPQVSKTFHGRDVFAPAAAWVARGVPPRLFGARIERPVLLSSLEPVRSRNRIEGRVIHVDHFGNLVTNLDPAWLSREGISLGAGWHLRLASVEIRRLVGTYSDAEPAEPVALVGSSGLIEISVRESSAAKMLGAGLDDRVDVVSSV